MSQAMAADWRIRQLRLVISCGLLATLLIAPRLWFAHPFFGPQSPFPWTLPVTLDAPIYLALVALVVPGALGWHSDRWLGAWVALFGIRAAFDQTLWQPYLYHYAAMILAAWLPPCAADALYANRLILVSIYFWSGANKVNYRFLSAGLEAVPGLEALLTSVLQVVPRSTFAHLGIVIPFIEIGVAIGLLVGGRSRRVAIGAAIAMHLLILAAMGPLGANHNPIVWPWNVVMIVLVVILFSGGDDGRADYQRILWNPRVRLHQFTLVAFALCPILGVFDLWPAPLSFRLYSYRLPTADIYVTEALRARLPAPTQAHIEPLSVTFDAGRKLGPYVGGLNISDWSEQELGAFIPPESRLYETTFERVCRLAPGATDGLLLAVSAPHLVTGQTQQSITTCGKN